MRSFYEFFAGGGMVRAGLGPKWRCLFANDFDHKKEQSYCKNWGDADLKTAVLRGRSQRRICRMPLRWRGHHYLDQDRSVAGGGADLTARPIGLVLAVLDAGAAF